MFDRVVKVKLENNKLGCIIMLNSCALTKLAVHGTSVNMLENKPMGWQVLNARINSSAVFKFMQIYTSSGVSSMVG